MTSISPFLSFAQDDSGRIYFQQGLKVKSEGESLRAERLLRRAIDAEPGNPDYRFELGNLLIEREDFMSARFELEQAVMINPEYLPARYNLGLVYRELGMMSEAREEFRKILERDPYHLKAQMQMGYTYEAQGFFEDARLAFQKAHDMDITNPEPGRALEEIELAEQEAAEQSQSDMRYSMARNQQRLYNPDFLNSNPDSQGDNKGALMQAGIALLQQMMSRRSQSSGSQN